MAEPGTALARMPAVRADARQGTLDAFVDDLVSSPDFKQFREDVVTTTRNRFAKNTLTSYDYWLGRLEKWLKTPTTRFRFREVGPMPLAALWPIGWNSEDVIVSWLGDITKGPTDPEAYQEWAEETGPMSPSTLGLILAAIKAAATERQEMPWKPSTSFQNYFAGLTRELRESYGSDRQAEPLLGHQHVTPIAAMLSPVDPPDASRDRLLLELHAAGVDGGGTARLRMTSVREPRPGIAAADHRANVALYNDTGDVGQRSLIIPGQRRRGGNADADAVVTLADHPQLERALDGYLNWRRTQDDGDGRLLLLAPSNPHHQVRSSLGRLADLSPGVKWRPARHTRATQAEVRRMREALDRGLDWSGQLLRRRDHVMLLVGYLCALRRSELCSLTIGDITLDDQRAIVTITKSKSDQRGRGVRLSLGNTRDGPAHLQSAHLLREWIALLRDEFDAGRKDPLFPALNRHGDLQQRGGAPMHAMDPQVWSDRLRVLALEAQVFGDDDTGRYDRVSGHSLRRGFVTSGILAGQDPVTIAKQTRHKNVQMIATYADELYLLEATDWAQVHFGDQTLLGGEATVE